MHACEARARGIGLGAFGELVADNYYGWSGGSAGIESKGLGAGNEGGQRDDLSGVEVGQLAGEERCSGDGESESLP